jgi:peptidoglycan-N-acetylglucosamine deacetylase
MIDVNAFLNRARLLAASLFVLVAASPALRAEDPAPKPEPNGVSSAVRVDACASDTSLLGLSRVVEIDTAGGPEFGGGYGHTSDFLKDGEVVLTFDDGPLRPYTRPVLKALAAHCTKATFFMVGRMAAADPALVKEVGQAGHTIASHTWSHQNLRPLSQIKGRQEFEMGFAAVSKAAGGQSSALFRFPYLSGSKTVTEHLKNRNVAAIWVDVDSKDYLTRDPKSVHRRVMSELSAKRKGIILMHDIQPSTANAIKGLLDDLHAKGFKVVHIVPKAPVETVSNYNAEVDKAFKDKSTAAAANPIASRSVVWSMAPSAAGAAGDAAKAARATGKPASAGDEELPWLKNSSKANSVAKSAPAKASGGPKGEILPWQPNLFGY